MVNGAFFDEDHYNSLLAEMRKTRLSERRFYQKVTDINDLTNMFLVFAEDEAKERHVMTMKDWINVTDGLLKFRHKQVLKHSGKISHKRALEKAESEYGKYRVIQDQNIFLLWMNFIINI